MKKVTPKVCVLLAAYNGEESIASQLSSLLYQTGVQVEIYISVDLSSDRTVEVIEGYIEKHNNIKLISENVRFGSAAKNFYHLIENVDVASYQYVSLADQDDIWFPDKLIRSIEKLEANNAQGFSSDVYSFWPEKRAFSTVKKSLPVTPVDHFFGSPGPGCSQVFTSPSFKKFQGFLAQNRSHLSAFDYHDWLIYAFYKETGLGWVISDNPRMLYIQHGNNQIGANAGFSGVYKRIKMVRSKWYRTQIEMLASVFNRPEILKPNFIMRNITVLRREKFSSLIVGLMIFLRFM